MTAPQAMLPDTEILQQCVCVVDTREALIRRERERERERGAGSRPGSAVEVRGISLMITRSSSRIMVLVTTMLMAWPMLWSLYR